MRRKSWPPRAGIPSAARALRAKQLADFFEQMDEADAVDVASHLDLDAVTDVLDEMEPDMAADLLAELEPDEAARTGADGRGRRMPRLWLIRKTPPAAS